MPHVMLPITATLLSRFILMCWNDGLRCFDRMWLNTFCESFRSSGSIVSPRLTVYKYSLTSARLPFFSLLVTNTIEKGCLLYQSPYLLIVNNLCLASSLRVL